MPPGQPLRVLAVASECYPLVKTGGLADVVGALPAALAAEAVAVTTLLPGYPAVLAAIGGAAPVRTLPELFGGPARVLAARAQGLDLLVLDAPHLYARPGNPYLGPQGSEWDDNGLRFAALGAAAAQVAREEGFAALHAHDWQAGLAGAYLRYAPAPRVPSVFTIHNLAFQGQFPAALFPRLGLPPAAFAMAGLEHYGSVGFLKSGLWFADRITTVSPTYAAEIRTPEGGMGLDGLLRGRGDIVHGILNGIDAEEWNPATDARLPARFSAGNPKPRAVNKAALQQRLGLEPDPGAPLFAFVGRLAWQKGMDLVLEALPALLGGGAQLAILGTGDAALEARCRAAAAAHPGRIGTLIAFDETLARLCYGGADLVLVPSRFEPCGLAQLCALRYGAPPLVARVGGLADTVIDANEMALAAGAGTGVQFAPVTAEMLGAAIQRGIGLWRDRAAWARIQANALATDVSWRRSAGRYAALFRELAATHA
jgi:starch synthase